MSGQALSVSLYNRWNNAGLDTSIAKLYPSGDSPRSGKNSSGSPEGSGLPRAEYTLVFPPPATKTRHSRIHQAVAVISVWGETKEATDGYVSTMRNTFINSEEAGTNPMTMTGGEILEVDDGGGSVMKVDDSLFVGEQTILIRCRINNTVPA